METSLIIPGGAGPPLSTDELARLLFSFCARPGERTLATRLRFELNGRISGYRHPNETGWRFADGKLIILHETGRPTCVADPILNSDGTLSFVGNYLLDNNGEIQHHFDQITDVGLLPRVFTYDLFDTLVARRCYEPSAIFDRIERRAGLPGFAQVRRHVEHRLFHAGEYTFDHIYEALGLVTGWPKATLSSLRMLELAEEWDNLFPIAEMVERVGIHDMVITDMYLPLDFVRRIVEQKCGLPNRVIHLSAHGKRLGEVWQRILQTRQIGRHHGDNPHSDVRSPNNAGIDAEHISVSRWTSGEQVLGDIGLGSLAMSIREARLTSFDREPAARLAQLAQLEINLPLLMLASLLALRRARERQVDTLLMCTRDCNLWLELIRWMAMRSATPVAVRYLVASRILFLSKTVEYVSYFNRMRGRRNLLIDVTGTGRSTASFIGQIGAQTHTDVFIAAGTPQVSGWVGPLAPARDDVRVEFLLLQPFVRQLLIEALNMSLEDRAFRVSFDGCGFFAEREPNEFGPAGRSLIVAMRDVFMRTIKLLDSSETRICPEEISEQTLRAAADALITLSDRYRESMLPVIADVLREEPQIASRAHAELQSSR